MASSPERDERWRTLRVSRSDYAYLEQRAREDGTSIAGALHALIERIQESDLVGVSDKNGTRIGVDVPPLSDPFHTHLFTTEGARFEDFDRFHLVAAVAYLRDLARHLIPKVAVTVEDRAEAELRRLYGEPRTHEDDPDRAGLGRNRR